VKTSLALLPFAAVVLRAEPAARDINWVSQRVAALAPTRDERRLDEIGWAPSLLEAERLSKSSRRPVFLFTHDGRMGTGRC
jgi:hypothetical protein